MIYDALKFGAALGEKIDIGSGASISNLTKQTIVLWVNVTTLTNARHLYGSRGANIAGAFASVYRLFLTGTSGNLNFTSLNTNGTSRCNVSTTDTPLATVGLWTFVAVSYDDSAAANSNVVFYSGTITTPPVVRANGGSSLTLTIATEDTGNAMWANRNNATGGQNQPLQGDIALGQLYNRVLSPFEVTQAWADPTPLGGCVNNLLMAGNGTSYVRDLSGYGNHGAVTGAVTVFNPLPRLNQPQFEVALWKRALFPPSTTTRNRLPLLGVS